MRATSSSMASLRSTPTASSSPSARRAYQALGAYWWGAATAPLFWSLMFIPSLYDVQTIHVSTNAVFTNTAPTSVYRGAGRPEAIYLIERLVERAAQVTGIDRVELRRRNLIKPEALPYHTPTHHNYDSGEFEKLMDTVPRAADWNGFAGAPEGQRAAGQAARPRGHALYRARRRFQRAHGNPVRSRRHGDDHCRHAFARSGTRYGVFAARCRMARRAVRSDQLHPGRHRKSGFRPRHVRGAQLAGRRQRTARCRRRDHRARQGNGRRAHGGGAGRHRIQRRDVYGRRNRQAHVDRRCGARLFCSGRSGTKLGLGLDGVGTWSGVPAARPIIRTDARYAKSRSIRRPARCTSTASLPSTISA